MNGTENSQAETEEKPGILKRLMMPFGQLFKPESWQDSGKFRMAAVAFIPVFLFFWIVSELWDSEPDLFDVHEAALARAQEKDQLVNGELVTGYTTTVALLEVANKLLDKPGGYLSNDKLPPSVFMDNIPNWEFGVLTQVRDFALAMRNDLTRSQSQSTEDKDWGEAQPKFNFDNNSWLVPPTEGQYEDAMEYVDNYLKRLTAAQSDAQFFARADNLRDWLKTVEKRLGSLSQRLSASVSQDRINTDTAGDADAHKARSESGEMRIKTPWLEIDDVFYEARGMSWALIHLMRAVEVDFRHVLQKKNALVSLRQIIRELESTQGTVWSPMIMNGSEFGLFSNHSLVMSSYISRANAAIIDLRSLLAQG